MRAKSVNAVHGHSFCMHELARIQDTSSERVDEEHSQNEEEAPGRCVGTS